MKKMLKYSAFLLVLVLLLGMSVTAFAEDKYPEGTVFTLTYPDGSSITTTDYAKAQKMTQEWKLLASGTTNGNGEIVLEDWAESGEIRIVETQAPSGYVKLKYAVETDLSEGSVKIVNEKAGKGPKTGDESQPLLWAVLILFSLLVLSSVVLFLRKKKEQ